GRQTKPQYEQADKGNPESHRHFELPPCILRERASFNPPSATPAGKSATRWFSVSSKRVSTRSVQPTGRSFNGLYVKSHSRTALETRVLASRPREGGRHRGGRSKRAAGRRAF